MVANVELELKSVQSNPMRRSLVLFVAALVGLMVTGCFTMSPEEQREAYQKEFARLAALPPAGQVATPDPDLANIAKLSCDLFNEVQPMMKAYAAKVESSREFTGFMNDVQYYVKEEKMSEKDACKKVMDDVVASDAKRAEGEKVWPKIQKGIAAANELDPKKQLVQIATLIARNTEISKSVQGFKESPAFKNGDYQAKLARANECGEILNQLEETGKCLYFLQDQFTRVVELDNCSR